MTIDNDQPELLAEMVALHRRLREIYDTLDLGDPVALPRVVSRIPAPSYASYARSVVTAQQRLSRYFDINLFLSPVLHMMLEMFAAEEGKQTISVKDACKASAVPSSTARRWLKVMQAHGLILCVPEEDGAEHAITLTPDAGNRLRAWLAEIASIPLRREWQD